MSPSSRSPKNFSWLVPGKLCGMGRPETPAHYGYLRQQGVRHLVTLCEEDGPPGCEERPWLTLHRVPVADFTPPTPEQIRGFLSVVEEANAKGEAVGVHCMFGMGRTGTMLACYLVRTRGVTAAAAILEVRRLRPGSIETPAQEAAVDCFSKMTSQ